MKMRQEVLLLAAAAVTLAGCADGDSTATSTPSLTVSNSVVLQTVPPRSTAAAPSAPASSASAPVTTAPATAASQSVPSGFPGPPPPPPPGAKEQGYLDELQKRGVTPARKENALTIASMVCQGVREGKPDAHMAPYVNASAGADGGGVTGDRTVEQVGQIYIAVARATYCK